MYYSVVLLVALCLTAIADASEEDCKKLASPHYIICCNRRISHPHNFDMKDVRECLRLRSKDPSSCDVDKCLAKNKGFASDDGSIIDKKALKADIEMEFEKDPEFMETVQKECIDGDLSEYGPSDVCDLKKFRNCIHMQFIATCPEWDDKGPCEGVKDLFDKCSKE